MLISIPVTLLENCWPSTSVAVVLFACHVICCMCCAEGNDQFLENTQGVLICFVTHSDSSNYKVCARFELRSWRKKEEMTIIKFHKAGWFRLHFQASEKLQLIAMVGIRKVWMELVTKWMFFPQMKYQLNSTSVGF